MTYEKVLHSGAHRISDVIDGYLVVRTYYFMTKREAICEFKAEFKVY